MQTLRQMFSKKYSCDQFYVILWRQTKQIYSTAYMNNITEPFFQYCQAVLRWLATHVTWNEDRV